MKASMLLKWILKPVPWAFALAILPCRILGEAVISCEFIEIPTGLKPRDICTSADGSTVAGNLVSQRSGNRTDSFIWRGARATYFSDLTGPAAEISDVAGISADGSTVIATIGEEAFRLKDGVLTGLGFLPGKTSSQAFDVNADGSVVVGRSDDLAFRWEDGVMASLGDLPGGSESSLATVVSADGSIVTGLAGTFNGARSFRWEDGVMEGFGEAVTYDIPWVLSVIPTAMSADGRRVIRFRRLFDLEDNLVVDLGTLPSGVSVQFSRDLSDDGTTTVGFAWASESDSFPYEAFRWASGSLMSLGEGVAESVSSDGSVVSGYLKTVGSDGAVFWSAHNDWQAVYLDDLLDEAGFNRDEYHLTNAIVSDDGSSLIALATYGGSSRIYRIRLTDITLDPLVKGAPIEAEEDWFLSDWFGIYCTTFAPWLFHAEHGFLYRDPESTNESLFVYDEAMGTWCWTNEAMYPFIYAYDPPADRVGTDIDSAWLFYFRDSDDGRVFSVLDGPYAVSFLFYGP